MINERVKIWGAEAARWTILGGLTIFLAFPFVWMLITAFKRTSDLYDLKHNPFLFYEPPTLEHIHRLFSETQYGEWLLNTAFVGVLVVLITLVLAVPAGYALMRLTGKWGEKLGIGIFLTYLVPPTLLFIPLSRVVVNLHLDDSLWSLVLVYPSFTVPFSAWLMMGFFKAIPKDLEEAAMVDGYSRLGAFFRVVVPISLAGILTVAIFSFTLVMQEFVYAVTFISSVRNMTVSVGCRLSWSTATYISGDPSWPAVSSPASPSPFCTIFSSIASSPVSPWAPSSRPGWWCPNIKFITAWRRSTGYDKVYFNDARRPRETTIQGLGLRHRITRANPAGLTATGREPPTNVCLAIVIKSYSSSKHNPAIVIGMGIIFTLAFLAQAKIRTSTGTLSRPKIRYFLLSLLSLEETIIAPSSTRGWVAVSNQGMRSVLFKPRLCP